MTQQRKRYSAELKAKVALEAIKGTRQPMRLRQRRGPSDANCPQERLHQALGYQTPAQVYTGK
jgi:hypothetical protein